MRKTFVTLFGLLVVLCSIGSAQEYFHPYLQKAVGEVTIDGELDEWNYVPGIDLKIETMPEGSRPFSENWIPDDNFDLSGTVKLMWDEEYLYVCAIVRDDIPGVLPNPPSWDGDVFEIYMANWDVGDVPWDPNPSPAHQNGTDGLYSFQVAFFYDGDNDSTRIYQWAPMEKFIESEKTMSVAKMWPGGDGYVHEGRLAWEDLSGNEGNAYFNLQAGDILPFSITLYDRDDAVTSDFQGYQFSKTEFPTWQGPGKGWQTIQLMDAREEAWYRYSYPYMKMSNGPVTIDGELDEWNFCFPVDMNQSSIPDNSRAQAWMPDDDVDCSAPIYFMFDDQYLYVGAAIRDDVPGVVPQYGGWNMDAIELYMGNYDIGDYGEIPDHAGYINQGDELDVQLGFYWDGDADSAFVYFWNPGDKAGFIPVGGATVGAGKLWDEGDGYNIEIALSLQDIANKVDDLGARTFNFVDHLYEIFPATYSLYDRDDYDADDWQGYQYVPDAAAPYLGASGGGWEGVQILPNNLYDTLGWLWDNYVGVEEKPAAATQYRLLQNYPNPFNPTTTIEYSLKSTSPIKLTVYNILGAEVATLVNTTQSAGNYRVDFDGANLTGGVYFYKITAGDFSETQRMVLLK